MARTKKSAPTRGPRRRGKRIVVAGDVAVDWFMRPVGASDAGENWRLFPGCHSHSVGGGAFLLTDFVRRSCKAAGVSARVAGPEEPADLRSIGPEKMVHSTVRLGTFGARGGGDVLRIEESLGYTGPQASRGTAGAPPRGPDGDVADVIVLDDAGNAFRHAQRGWPAALKSPQGAIIVYKMSRPLARGPLWASLTSPATDALVVVVSANDLRRTRGVHISAALSWERTAKDFVFQMQRSEKLKALQQCPYLVVTFDTDGAILYRGGELARATLIFDPNSIEGGFAKRIDGRMMGHASVFAATLAGALAKDGVSALPGGIKLGLARSRELLEAGYIESAGIHYPNERLFSPEVSGEHYAACPIDPPRGPSQVDPGFWRILDQRTRNTRLHAAQEIVEHGASKALAGVPVGVFGKKLKTIDRAEIEKYNAIRELLEEFLANPKSKRPLCFAVFGPPGSGKSFGVMQVLESLNRDDLKAVTFNMSQFAGYDDLVAAFHEVRDIALAGKVPCVFFDEFDSAPGGEPLGWLKYFLAPMQDGEFKSGQAVHPVGKAVFAFAGGTRSSFEKFLRNAPDDTDDADDADARKRAEQFRGAKGPDFVSRLRGVINVMGPNRQRRQGDDDDAFIIRRAKVLRGMLEREPTAAGLFASSGRLDIDRGVLRALLNVRRYTHGTRSMGAILEMSRLAGKKCFDQSALPLAEQLGLHVDADEFGFFVEKERYQSMFRLRDLIDPDVTSWRENEETIVAAVAERIHDSYARQRLADGQSPVAEPFDALSADLKQSNIDAAEDLPNKLRQIGHGLRRIPRGREARTPDITDREVEHLARLEHDRWCRERRLLGWTCGRPRDEAGKVSPYLVEFDRLPEDVRDYDRQAVRAIPVILRELGYEVYRTVEVDELADPALIDRLARIGHRQYVKERKKEGQTVRTNRSMAPFDKLSDDLREANLDNAATIPRKLKSIGYGVRRVLGGRRPRRLRLTARDIRTMAELEHVRWNWQKILQGWIHGKGPKNEKNKTTPWLRPWSELPARIKAYDVQSVSLIPRMLQEAGYEAVRIDPGKDRD